MRWLPDPMVDSCHTDHTFAVCAYKESAFLEDCIKSVVEQTVKSNVIVCTPTPCDFITNICKKYDLPLFINTKEDADAQDSWNFALQSAGTKYVTICHQDDCYDPRYFETVRKYFDDKLLFLHTNYKNIFTDENNNSTVRTSKNVVFKRIIHFFFANKWQQSSIFFKKCDLSFGNSICCPTCTYNKSNLEFPLFISKYRHGIDWDLYIKLACRPGRVAYVRKPVLFKRIHVNSQTTDDVRSGVRKQEDIEIYSRLWPGFMSKILQKILSRFYNAG